MPWFDSLFLIPSCLFLFPTSGELSDFRGSVGVVVWCGVVETKTWLVALGS